jgi:hypothetical protein
MSGSDTCKLDRHFPKDLGRTLLAALSCSEKSGGPGSARMPRGRGRGLEHSAHLRGIADGGPQRSA